MHQSIPLTAVIGLLLVGCGANQPDADSPRRLVTTKEEYTPRFSELGIRVDAEDGGLHFLSFEPTGNSVTTPHWVASPGWFGYFESSNRVWAYDGVSNLMVFARYTTACSIHEVTPCCQPFPVPTPVMIRLKQFFRSQLENGRK